MGKSHRPVRRSTNRTGLDEYLKSLEPQVNWEQKQQEKKPVETENQNTSFDNFNPTEEKKVLPDSFFQKKSTGDSFDTLFKPTVIESIDTPQRTPKLNEIQNWTPQQEKLNQYGQTIQGLKDEIEKNTKNLDRNNKDQVNYVNQLVTKLNENINKLKTDFPIFNLPQDVVEHNFENGINVDPKQTSISTATPENWTNKGFENPFDKMGGINDQQRAANYVNLKKALNENISISQAEKENSIWGTPAGRLGGSFIQGVSMLPQGIFSFGDMIADEIGMPQIKEVYKTQSMSLDKILNDVAPADPNIMEDVMSGVGSMLGYYLPGRIVSQLGKISNLAPKVAKWMGIGTSTVLESVSEAGLVYKQSGDSDAATKTLIANLFLVAITNRFGIQAEEYGKIKKVLMSVPTEGLQEGFQEIISDASQGKKIDWDMIASKHFFETPYGRATGIGGFIGGGTSFVDGGNGTLPTTPEQQTPDSSPLSGVDIAPEQQVLNVDPNQINQETGFTDFQFEDKPNDKEITEPIPQATETSIKETAPIEENKGKTEKADEKPVEDGEYDFEKAVKNDVNTGELIGNLQYKYQQNLKEIGPLEKDIAKIEKLKKEVKGKGGKERKDLLDKQIEKIQKKISAITEKAQNQYQKDAGYIDAQIENKIKEKGFEVDGPEHELAYEQIWQVLENTERYRVSFDPLSKIINGEIDAIEPIKKEDTADEPTDEEIISDLEEEDFADETIQQEEPVKPVPIEIKKNADKDRIEILFNDKKPTGDDIEFMKPLGLRLKTGTNIWHAKYTKSRETALNDRFLKGGETDGKKEGMLETKPGNKPGTKKKIVSIEDFNNASTPEVTNFVKSSISEKEFNKLVKDAAENPDNNIPVEGKTVEDMQAGAIESAIYAKAQDLIYEKQDKKKTEPDYKKVVEDAGLIFNGIQKTKTDMGDLVTWTDPETKSTHLIPIKDFNKETLLKQQEKYKKEWEGAKEKREKKEARGKKPEVKPESVEKVFNPKPTYESILNAVDTTNDKSLPGKTRVNAKKDMAVLARKLLQNGITAQVKSEGGKWAFYIDGKKQNRISLGLVERAEKVDLEKIDYENYVSDAYEFLEIEVKDRQEIVAFNFVEASDLPSGSGPSVLEKGKKDLKENHGKETSPEAKAVRKAAEDILKNGASITRVKGTAKEFLGPEEIQSFVDEKIEETAIKQMNEDEASEEETASAEAIINKAELIEQQIKERETAGEGTEAEQKQLDSVMDEIFGEAVKLGYPKKKKSIFGKQESFENLSAAKMPDKPITGKGKGEESTPLFQQETEDKNQTDMFGKPKEEVTEISKVASASSRFRPKEFISFDPPLIGSTGAKLTGYVWQYEWIELEDDKKKRISDWTRAEVNDDTGRDIVHQYSILTPGGEYKTVSSESVLVLLGYTEKNAPKKIGNIINLSKTLAKNKMLLHQLELQEQKYNEVKTKYEKAKKPEIVEIDAPEQIFEHLKANHKKGHFNIYAMGDVWRMVDNDYKYDDQKKEIVFVKRKQITDRDKEQLGYEWIAKRIREEGIEYPQGIRDLKNRVERQQKKINDILKNQSQIEPKDRIVSEEVYQAAKKRLESKTESEIKDFGEKIGGARKDYYNSLTDAKSLSIEDEPLSKTFPLPDYQKLIDKGIDPKIVALVRVMRDEIPIKPRQGYKLKKYKDAVELYRNFAEELLTGKLKPDVTFEMLDKIPGLKGVRDLVDLYTQVGHENSLKGIKIEQHFYNTYNSINYNPPIEMWTIEQKQHGGRGFPKIITDGKTRKDVIDNFVKLMNGKSEKIAKPTRYSIYSKRGTEGYIIGKKLGRNFIDLKTFPTVKEAREFMKNNHADLDNLLDKSKYIPNERNLENREREGNDYRNGKDVSPDEFMDNFQFRGVEFGNWVSKTGERQTAINNAFDALKDLAEVTHIPDNAISLNGNLGIAFGSRGIGGLHAPVAHYEPGKVVINLTRKQGAGSLGHEWWHALDNYFAKKMGKDYVTESLNSKIGDLRPEVFEAYKKVMDVIKNETKLKTRSERLDTRRSSPYWATDLEMSARAFENYLIEQLRAENISNDYLANIVGNQTFIQDMVENIGDPNFEAEDYYPYLYEAELPKVMDAFDNFFQTLKVEQVKRETPERSRFISEESYQQALKRLDKTIGKLYTGLDPTMIKDLVIVGAYKIENGIIKLKDWIAEMRKDFKNIDDVDLRKIYDQSKKMFDAAEIERKKQLMKDAKVPEAEGSYPPLTEEDLKRRDELTDKLNDGELTKEERKELRKLTPGFNVPLMNPENRELLPKSLEEMREDFDKLRNVKLGMDQVKKQALKYAEKLTDKDIYSIDRSSAKNPVEAMGIRLYTESRVKDAYQKIKSLGTDPNSDDFRNAQEDLERATFLYMKGRSVYTLAGQTVKSADVLADDDFMKTLSEMRENFKKNNPYLADVTDELIKLSDKPGWKDYLQRLLYESVLSNPFTDVANIFGNFSMLGSELSTRIFSLKNIRGIATGLLEGNKAGLEQIKKVYLGQTEADSKFTEQYKRFELIKPTTSNKRIARLLLPTTRLAMEDAYFKAMAASIEKNVTISRIARENKITADEVVKEMEAVLNDPDLADPKKLRTKAEYFRKYADYLTFQTELGSVGKAFQRITTIHQNDPLTTAMLKLPLKMTMLFVRTPANILKAGFDFSPAGFMRLTNKTLTEEERAAFTRRAIAGTVFYSALGSAIASGLLQITGQGPDDDDQKDVWMRLGYRPNHIYLQWFDGTMKGFSYQNINPFNVLFGFIGNLSDAYKFNKKLIADDKDVSEKLSIVLRNMALTMSDQSYLKGVSNFFQWMEQGNENFIQDLFVMPLVPGIVSFPKTLEQYWTGDRTVYNANNLGERIERKMGINDNLQEVSDVSGEPKQSGWERFPFPIQTVSKREKVLENWILDNQINLMQPGKGTKIGDAIMIDAQLMDYKRESNKKIWDELNRYLPVLRQKTTEEAQDWVDDLVRGERKIAKLEIINNLDKYLANAKDENERTIIRTQMDTSDKERKNGKQLNKSVRKSLSKSLSR